jgi:homoserine O-succinyltransferase
MHTSSHKSKNTSEDHLLAFYTTFDKVKDRYFDGLVITGAPVEMLEFEEVEYWNELCEIMEWSTTHVHSTFHICWGAQAGLYYHFGVKKKTLDKKMFGVFPHIADYKRSMLFRGFDDVFMVPHSRHTTIDREDLENIPGLKILASSPEAGVFALSTKKGRQIFITGHPEYDAETLGREYWRDVNAGKPIEIPKNYYPENDPTKAPVSTWRCSANLLYCNWLNYFVYQTTPFDLQKIKEAHAATDESI